MASPTQQLKTAISGAITHPGAARELTNYLGNIAPGVGNIWYVDSGVGNNNNSGKASNAAVATLDDAVGKATANNGDIIYLLPGHAETLSADSAVDIDVAGLTVISVGQGGDRATFTLDTAVTADFKLAAANTVIINLLFVAGLNALTGPIEVSAADCQIIDCEYRDSTGVDTIDVVVTTAAADRLLIDGFRYVFDGDGTLQSVINILTGCDQVEIRNCFLVADADLGPIEVGQATNVDIHHNVIDCVENTNDVCITLGSTSTGMVHHNMLKLATDGQVTWITAVNDCALFENYGVNADAETGGVIGTVSTAS